MVRWLPELVNAVDLTGERYMVLFELGLLPDTSLKDLAEALGVSPSALSVMVQSLIDRFQDYLQTLEPSDRSDLVEASCALLNNGSSELFNSVSAGITTFFFNRVILLYIGSLGVAALTVVQYPIMLAVMIATERFQVLPVVPVSDPDRSANGPA